MIFTPWFSRLAALVLTLVCIFMVWLFWASPLFQEIVAEQSSLKQNLERLSRYQALQKREQSIDSALDDAKNQPLSVYAGASVSAMAASLQRDIGQLVAASGMSLGSVRPNNNTSKLDEHGFLHLMLQINVRGTTTQLSDLLKDLKNHPQLLIVEKSSIRALDNGTVNRAANLSVSFDISAYGEIVK